MGGKTIGSPNPNFGGKRPGAGRKKGTINRAQRQEKMGLAALAKQYTEEAIQIIVKIARDPKVPAAARVSAVAHLLDRAYGRPPQAIELSGDPNKPVEVVHHANFAAMNAAERAEAYREMVRGGKIIELPAPASSTAPAKTG
jgi:hypothetical protein